METPLLTPVLTRYLDNGGVFQNPKRRRSRNYLAKAFSRGPKGCPTILPTHTPIPGTGLPYRCTDTAFAATLRG